MNFDPYKYLNHKALNGPGAKSQWMNMGLWFDDEDEQDSKKVSRKPFPQACEDLARELHKLTGLDERIKDGRGSSQPHLHILDLAHSHGDSLILLLDRFAPHIKRLHGVTYNHDEATTARQRVSDWFRTHPEIDEEQIEWQIWEGDAVTWLKERAKTVDEEGGYDYILALDCAYHFQDRLGFYQASYQNLKEDGTLGLYDLWAGQAVAQSKRQSNAFTSFFDRIGKIAWTLFLLVAGIRLITVAEMQRIGSQAGFSDDQGEMQVWNKSSQVFSGFGHFLKNVPDGTEKDKASGYTGLGWSEKLGLGLFGKVVERWGSGEAVAGLKVDCGIVVLSRQPQQAARGR